MKLLAALFVACGLLAQQQPAPPSAQGHWEGTLALPNQEMAVVVDIDKDAKGAWIGSFGAPEREIVGLELKELTVDGAKVHFFVLELPGAPEFKATLKSDALMECSVEIHGSPYPLTLKRTGAAKVVGVLPSPAVDARFEGDYEGKLEPPGESIAVIFHIHNTPDKTVKVTVDVPRQDAKDLPMTEIVQKGADIQMRLRMAGGVYRAKLSDDARTLDGEWEQGGATFPLKLTRSAEKKP